MHGVCDTLKNYNNTVLVNVHVYFVSISLYNSYIFCQSIYTMRTKIILLLGVCFLVVPTSVKAEIQHNSAVTETQSFSGVLTEQSSSSVSNIIDQINVAEANKKDVTQAENLPEKVAILSLFEARRVESPGIFSFIAYWVQTAVQNGIPANTIFLILLTPVLGTLVSFVRVVVGLPTLDMLVPIILAFALVAVGVTMGILILLAVLTASYVSKVLLSRIQIMFYPKRSLSMLLLAVSVFGALTIASILHFDKVLSLSIFPILILMLLGDSIVSVQLHKSASETFSITSTTLMLGLFGYFLASSTVVQDTLILYPELILLVIPMNIIIGRYFGLRLTEYFRFNTMSD